MSFTILAVMHVLRQVTFRPTNQNNYLITQFDPPKFWFEYVRTIFQLTNDYFAIFQRCGRYLSLLIIQQINHKYSATICTMLLSRKQISL